MLARSSPDRRSAAADQGNDRATDEMAWKPPVVQHRPRVLTMRRRPKNGPASWAEPWKVMGEDAWKAHPISHLG